MSDRLHDVGRAVCDRRGYDVTTPEQRWLPATVADPTPDTDPFVPHARGERVAVEPVDSDDLTPTLLLSRLRNNRNNDRFSLFVVERSGATAAREILADPPLVAAEDAHGRRTFYNGPDRIRLAEGGYAAVRTDSPPERLVWCEAGDADDHSLHLVDDGADVDAAVDANDETRTPGSASVLAVLDDVDSLGCPPASRFPYSYRRRSTDKRFRIRRRDGDVVGVYGGVSALRANAYVPVPMPLVPEHVFAGVNSVRDEWAVLVVGDADGAGSDTSRTAVGDDVDIRLLTADRTA